MAKKWTSFLKNNPSKNTIKEQEVPSLNFEDILKENEDIQTLLKEKEELEHALKNAPGTQKKEAGDPRFRESEIIPSISHTIREQLGNVSRAKGLEKEPEAKRKTVRVKPKERHLPPMEVDLHIDKLVKSYKHMTNYDILTLQIDTAARQLNFAISKRIPKMVFIHGVGQGVLKEELYYLLNKYDGIKFYSADYQKYGAGATEVYIYQNAQRS